MRAGSHKQKAFSLIEIMLAMTILVLVMASVFSILRTGILVYRGGQTSMEIYQSGRIAIQRLAEELRFALSPNAFWRPEDNYVLLPLEHFLASFQGRFVEEEDPGAITFKGEGNSILFCRKIYNLNRYPPFDLQECRIYVDDSQNLILEVVRSLLAVKQMSWLFRIQFEVNLNGQVVQGGPGGRTRIRQMGQFGEPPLLEYIGNYGMDGRKFLIANNIDEIRFRYTDGSGWSSNWDSQQLITHNRISPQSPNFNPQSDTMFSEKGPPQVVEVTLTLTNGDHYATAVDIPAGNMQKEGLDLFARPSGVGQSPAAPGQPGTPGARPETPMAVPRAGI